MRLGDNVELLPCYFFGLANSFTTPIVFSIRSRVSLPFPSLHASRRRLGSLEETSVGVQAMQGKGSRSQSLAIAFGCVGGRPTRAPRAAPFPVGRQNDQLIAARTGRHPQPARCGAGYRPDRYLLDVVYIAHASCIPFPPSIDISLCTRLRNCLCMQSQSYGTRTESPRTESFS